VAAVGSPLAVGTVLLYYFGWVRATQQARALGYDTTVLELTTADYLLKSIGLLFLPLVTILLLALGLHRLHLRLLGKHGPDSSRSDEKRRTEPSSRKQRSPALRLSDKDHRQDPIPRWVPALRRAWLGGAALGFVLYFGVTQLHDYALPFAITLTIGIYLYGRVVHAKFRPSERLSTVTRVLLLVLLGLAIFWDTERLARWYGINQAAEIAEDPDQFPLVTIYSKERLLITGPHVAEVSLSQPDSTYRYRCSGLRLIHRSGARYFLLAVGTTPDTGRLMVLQDGENVRLELGR
jgi:hypothetical protein